MYAGCLSASTALQRSLSKHQIIGNAYRWLSLQVYVAQCHKQRSHMTHLHLHCLVLYPHRQQQCVICCERSIVNAHPTPYALYFTGYTVLHQVKS